MRDYQLLERFENAIAFEKSDELRIHPVRGKFDLEHMQRIHRHLLGDVYNWAGQLRDVNMTKMGVAYAPYERIETIWKTERATQLPGSMNVRHPRISGCCICSDSSRFYVHPFREGNGRTQRVFWNRVALEAGWELDWRPVHGEENHSAARVGSDDGDLMPLIKMFDKIVALPSTKPGEDWPTQELRRLSINPADAD